MWERARDSSGKAFRLWCRSDVKTEEGGRIGPEHLRLAAQRRENLGLTSRAPVQKLEVPPWAEVARPRLDTGRCLDRAWPPLTCYSRCRRWSEAGGCQVTAPAAADLLSTGDPSNAPPRLLCALTDRGADSPVTWGAVYLQRWRRCVIGRRIDRTDQSPSTNPHVRSFLHARSSESCTGGTFKSLQWRRTAVQVENLQLAFLNMYF